MKLKIIIRRCFFTMYYLKSEHVEELKCGRTVKFIADILGINYAYLNTIFNGGKCKRLLALALININSATPLYNTTEIEKLLDYYFTKK